MEAGAVPRAAPAGVSGIASPRLLRVASDAHLVAMVRDGRSAAFETLYDRHSRAILSFCRHMLGSVEEAEDAVQHTFLAAYNDLISSRKPIQLRPWLFAIARNRCYSILRARREQPSADLDDAATEGLAIQVQRRQDLRDLVGDMRRLPQDQRAALVLSEMDSLSHEQIGDVLGVPKDKVKALVFQARESLVASRAARETDCSEIREQLANLRGGALRRANLRRHLRECAGCRAFRKEMEHQRRQLKVLLPVVPTIGLKEAVLGATIGGGATAGLTGGGLIAGSLVKTGAIKTVIGGIIAGVGTVGTVVAVNEITTGSSSPFSGLPKLVARAPITPAPKVSRSSSHPVAFTTLMRTVRSRTPGAAPFTRLTGTPVALRLSRGSSSRGRNASGATQTMTRGGSVTTSSHPVTHGTAPASGTGASLGGTRITITGPLRPTTSYGSSGSRSGASNGGLHITAGSGTTTSSSGSGGSGPHGSGSGGSNGSTSYSGSPAGGSPSGSTTSHITAGGSGSGSDVQGGGGGHGGGGKGGGGR